MARIVVVGGGYAGQCAMARIRALDRDVEVVLVEPREAFEERIRTHEVLAWGTRPVHALGPICEGLGVEHVRARCEHIGADSLVAGGRTLTFDAAVVALGSRTRDVPPGAVALDAVEAILAGRDGLGDAVTVVGAGLTGLEAATELAAARPDVTVELVRRGDAWEGFSDRAARIIDARLAQLGVDVVGAPTPGRSVVWCGGFAPVALDGLEAGPDGRVAVDACLFARPRVLVAGDMARPPVDVGTGCVTAMPMGFAAGANAVATVRGEAPAPFAMKKVLVCVSLGRGSAVVQQLDDGPTRALGGLPAALVKAGILRYTTAVVALERGVGRPVYTWPGRAA